MAVGLAMPVGVDASGGASIVSGDVQASKIIRLALSPCYNEHAFQQDIGVGEGMIFAINTPEGKARLRSRIRRLFTEFRAEDRFRLVDGSLKVEDGPGEGELTMELKYKDLEADEEYVFVEVLRNVTGV